LKNGRKNVLYILLLKRWGKNIYIPLVLKESETNTHLIKGEFSEEFQFKIRNFSDSF